METARSLRYVITRTAGPASSARRELFPRTVRIQATRGILLPSLVLAALGTVAVASPGHVSSGHVRSNVVLTSSCKIAGRPWMYAVPAIRTGPWAYGSSAIGGPQMNAINIKTAWMFAVPAIRTGPWAYGSSAVTGAPMNAVGIKTAWMYRAIIAKPWMYAPAESLRVISACPVHSAPS